MKTQIYTTESRVRDLPGLLREMLSGMRHSRYVAYRLTVKDIKSEYTKSAFGMVWDLFDPLVMGLVFYFLMRSRIINTEGMSMPYGVYIVAGLLLYQSFCDAMIQSVEMMTRSRGLLKHLKLAPESIMVSVFFRIMFSSSFRIAVIVLFAIVGGAFSIVGFGKFLVIYPVLVLAGMCIGIALAPFHAIYADVGRFVRLILTPLRFATPVVLIFPEGSTLDRFNDFNPVSLILVNLRMLITSNQTEALLQTTAACIVIAVIGLGGWLLFHLSVPILADRN